MAWCEEAVVVNSGESLLFWPALSAECQVHCQIWQRITFALYDPMLKYLGLYLYELLYIDMKILAFALRFELRALCLLGSLALEPYLQPCP
jgi:hypothetical protein